MGKKAGSRKGAAGTYPTSRGERGVWQDDTWVTGLKYSKGEGGSKAGREWGRERREGENKGRQ